MPELSEPAAPAAAPAVVAAKPSRALGIAALIIALVPIVGYLVVAFYPAVFPGPGESFGWLFLVSAILMVAAPLCGLTALILGIIAARRNRGRVAGIVAIVFASLVLLYSLLVLVGYALVALTYGGSY